jgi:Pyruvate/2-oxoacid:ferredoxin oxidoreductase delta subunit
VPVATSGSSSSTKVDTVTAAEPSKPRKIKAKARCPICWLACKNSAAKQSLAKVRGQFLQGQCHENVIEFRP